MKPDWKDAPASAKWLAMDKSGQWFWYEFKPQTWHGGLWVAGGNTIAASDTPPNWACSLERRP